MTTTGDDHPQPIIGVRRSEVAPRALVVGDPNRVDDVAARLDEPVEVGRYREYVTVTGRYGGAPVTIASHGVGASGAAICFEELCRAGVRTLVRAGTCGGLQPGVDAGHLVVATAAVRDDGLTSRLLPDGWPAVASPELTLALHREAAAGDLPVHRGVVHTAANFHPSPLTDDPGWWTSQRAGAVAVEMELAALFVVAGLHGASAGGILTADGNLLEAVDDMSDYDPETDTVTHAKSVMIDIALRVLAAS
jgi:uridine phosphorylase